MHVYMEHIELCVHMPVEAKDNYGCHSLCIVHPSPLFESRSLTELKLPRLAGQQVPGACLFLLFQRLGYKHVLSRLAFLTWALEIKLRSLCLQGSTFQAELSPYPCSLYTIQSIEAD